MYLFKPRPHAAEGPAADAEGAGLSATPFRATLLPLNTAALQPGSAAEWAIGELIIRLCNHGRGLRPEPPEAPTFQ